MKKKHVFMSVAFFSVGLVYGAIFNFILCGENASVLSSYLQGLFVGMLASAIYFMLFLFFGYCFDVILENIVATVGVICVIYGTTMFINSYNKAPITLTYAWMHIVNLLFAVAVVAKANYDGKVLRKNRKK